MSFIELFKKNKDDSKDKDINADKAFLHSIAISFFAIIVCIILLSASTFAWFTTTVESKGEITSSVYKLDIGVSYLITDGTETVTPTEDEKGNPVYELLAGKEYTVTVTAIEEGTTGKTGYIKLLSGGKSLYSEQINRGNSISFTLTFSADSYVTLEECWGLSARPEDERELTNGSKHLDLVRQ